MRTLHKILFALIIFSLAGSLTVFCQDQPDAKLLVKQGVALHDQGKYDAALAKYSEALKLDSSYQSAYYEMAYTLFATGKGNEALPYLEKLISLNPNSGEAFDLLGSIYDDNKQPDKAIKYYLRGIKVSPDYQRLYFNVAITYYRKEMYSESEKYAIRAMKLDPKHASSQRIYAMATYKTKKRGCSLLAWCSFLMLEPATKRSAEAFNYVHAILNYGIKQTGPKSVSITISDSDLGSGNLLMPMAITTATDSITTGGKQNLTRVDSLALQLTSLFKIATSITGEKEDPFVVSYFAKFFNKLGNTDNMPAFARFISLSAYREEDLQWFKDNDGKLTALDTWVSNTKREFQ